MNLRVARSKRPKVFLIFKMDAEEIIERLQTAPFVLSPHEGIGGGLKSEPVHFQVEEVMPYPPCGKGEHVYVTLRRAGWNTADVARELGRLLRVEMHDIGWAGLKDRRALTTQTFSLKMPGQAVLPAVAKQLAEETPFEILGVFRHTNKIRIGHVRANRFRILLSGDGSAEKRDSAQSLAESLCRTGLPNFYGPQRFGRNYANVVHAFRQFRAGRLRRKDKFYVSVVQAAAFNIWLTQRMEAGRFREIQAGDIAKKTDTGGMFTADAGDAPQRRFHKRELTYTGPIYGHKMMLARGAPGKVEAELAARLGLDAASMKVLKAVGSRRPALLWMDGIRVETDLAGLVFSFELPSGAYATTVMREFTRV